MSKVEIKFFKSTGTIIVNHTIEDNNKVVSILSKIKGVTDIKCNDNKYRVTAKIGACFDKEVILKSIKDNVVANTPEKEEVVVENTDKLFIYIVDIDFDTEDGHCMALISHYTVLAKSEAKAKSLIEYETKSNGSGFTVVKDGVRNIGIYTGKRDCESILNIDEFID